MVYKWFHQMNRFIFRNDDDDDDDDHPDRKPSSFEKDWETVSCGLLSWKHLCSSNLRKQVFY